MCNAYQSLLKCQQVWLQPSVAQQNENIMNLNTQNQIIKVSFLLPSQRTTYFNNRL